jgi:hypothetical protein
MAYEKMHTKVVVFAIIILLVSISFLPTISGNIWTQNNEKALKLSSNTSEEKDIKPILGNYKSFFYKDGICEETITTTLNRQDRKNLMNDLRSILDSEFTLHSKFEQFLETLKSYNLVSEDITLGDFLDEEVLNDPYERVNQTDFEAHFAPIIIVGGGIGIGLGYPDWRPFNVFLHLLTVVAGLGYVFCLDPIDNILYELTSFLFPLLFGYLSAYTGLILLAVFPGFFYSNLVAIGFTPFTSWAMFPPSESPEE